MNERILVTGASGFLGSRLVEEALQRGMSVCAGVRRGSSRKYLSDSRITFLELDFSSPERLTEQLSGQAFDYVVHCAGVTKCADETEFRRVNTDGTRYLADALLALNMPLKRFVYISSLSVFGPVAEQKPYREIQPDDVPRPDTAYGRSKLAAEQYLDSIGNDFPYIILRPTGIYGQRERDYYMVARSVQRHIDLSVGWRRQDLTFVYVDDVVQAVFLAFDRGMSGSKYFITDGRVYRQRDFGDHIARRLGIKWRLRVTVPLCLLRVAAAIGSRRARRTGKITAVNNDKYNIMRQRNWRCNIEPAMDELGYHPHFPMERGVALTIDWYKKEGWL